MYRGLSGYIDFPWDSSIDLNTDNAWAAVNTTVPWAVYKSPYALYISNYYINIILYVYIFPICLCKPTGPYSSIITSSSWFIIMTSNLFPVPPSLYFGRKLGLFLEAKYNITNSSRHFGPNGSLWTGLSPTQC